MKVAYVIKEAFRYESSLRHIKKLFVMKGDLPYE